MVKHGSHESFWAQVSLNSTPTTSKIFWATFAICENLLEITVKGVPVYGAAMRPKIAVGGINSGLRKRMEETGSPNCTISPCWRGVN